MSNNKYEEKSLKNPMSILKVYIEAIITEDGKIELYQRNSLNNPLKSMSEKIYELKEEMKSVAQEYNKNHVNFKRYNMELIVTSKEKERKEIEKAIDIIYEDIKYLRVVPYSLENNLKIYCVCRNREYDVLEQIIELWIDKEKPYLYGNQVLMNSYVLKDFTGRRIIGAFSSYEVGGWNLLLEGGIKLSLGSEENRFNKRVTSEDFAQWTVGEIETRLYNPIYSYGIYLQQIDLFYEWQRALIYQLAVLTDEISIEILEKIYDEFIEFIKEEVCDWDTAENIVTKETGISVINIEIDNMRKYLQGKEQSTISKNKMLTLSNRYEYMPIIQKLINKHLNKECNVKVKEKYDFNKLKQMIADLEKDTSYEKGKVMENLAEYFLKTIPNIKITGKRIKTKTEEIDLCFCNASLDENLWNLGALTVVECKNENEKFSSAQAKKIIQTMETKGSKSIMLFLREAPSSAAQKEIEEQIMYGKYIIVITKKDLENIKFASSYELLLEKIEEVKQIAELKMNELV